MKSGIGFPPSAARSLLATLLPSRSVVTHADGEFRRSAPIEPDQAGRSEHFAGRAEGAKLEAVVVHRPRGRAGPRPARPPGSVRPAEMRSGPEAAGAR